MSDEPIVFVVDDDDAARNSLAAMIRASGAAVKTYDSAEAFLDDYAPEQWGCLVTDVRMGGMSGLQLQQRLRERGIALPVVLISGYADVPTAVSAMRGGAVTFLEKPCTEEELQGSVAKAVAWHRQHRRVESQRAELQSRLAQLSAEEHVVMRAMVAGTPNKAIASDLHIGLRTVELRRANVMKKMGAESLAELVHLSIAADRLADAPR
ncbi:MAG: response regulator transcription factor [Pirellulales bacterium]|nr:response regulator transcription factor [Pirellulales bacterium]